MSTLSVAVIGLAIIFAIIVVYVWSASMKENTEKEVEEVVVIPDYGLGGYYGNPWWQYGAGPWWYGGGGGWGYGGPYRGGGHRHGHGAGGHGGSGHGPRGGGRSGGGRSGGGGRGGGGRR